MTTIACNRGSMAGDGYSLCSGTVVTTDALKVFRLKDGSLFGACGGRDDAYRLREWLDAGSPGEPPKVDEDFGAVMLLRDGTAASCGKSCRFVACGLPMAMGSGMDFALGAMDAGFTPENAVKVAIARDPRSGGTVVSLKLDAA